MKSDGATNIRGIDIISIEQGERLGTVSKIFFDPNSRTLLGFEIKGSRGNPDRYLLQKNTEVIGKDAILVNDHKAVETDKNEFEKAQSLAELKGRIVASTSGKVIGRLQDLDIDTSGAISELLLSDKKSITVQAQEVTIGPDQIVLPQAYEDKIVESSDGKKGYINRFFQTVRGEAQ